MVLDSWGSGFRSPYFLSRVALLVWFLFVGGGVVWAQERGPERVNLETLDYSPYQLPAVKVEQGPRIDGVLDDEVWRQAPVAAGFVQFGPDYLAPATERTEVRVLYDNQNVYIGAICYDSEPDKVVARETRRDAQTFRTDDTFAVSISPFPDLSNVYFFSTTPLGQQRDIFVGNFGEAFNSSWDGIWQVKAKPNSAGWSVEIAIPFKTFRFPSSEVQNWGVNFRRQIRRKRETDYWVPVSRADGFRGMYKLQKGGRLVGLKGVKPGRALEVLPYTVLGTIGKRTLPSGLITPTPSQTTLDFAAERDVGGDLKWGVTPNITVDATINPDFANIEADREVVNLSRFEFRFREKRPFFLEGVDLFNFGQPTGFMFGGPAAGVLPLFFSRRIGAQLREGPFVPIDLSAKVTGKVGRTNFAYLNAQTGRVEAFKDTVKVTLEPKVNWQILRLRQDLGRETSIGLMALSKEPGESFLGLARSGYNRVLGFDGFIRFGRTNHRLETLLAKSWLADSDPRMEALASRDQSVQTWAGSISHRWRNEYIDVTTSYTDIGAGFYADMGFIRRRDFRQFGWRASSQGLIRKAGIRQLWSFANFSYTDNHQGSFFANPESWEISLRPGFELENGLSLSAGWNREFDTLSRTMPIAGVHFPQGEYTFDGFSAGFNTDEGKSVVVEFDYTQGKFYDGNLRNIETQFTVKPMPRLLVSLDLENNRLDRPNPGPIADTQYKRDNTFISRFRFNYSFTPEFFISAFVQANRSKKTAKDHQTGNITTLISNFLVAYQMQSGHSFFLVYNQVADDDFSALRLSPLDKTPFKISGSAVVAKFQYLLNI